jgi:hypothetical protein
MMGMTNTTTTTTTVAAVAAAEAEAVAAVLAAAGDMATGGEPAHDVAREWELAGFDAAAVEAWLGARCFRASAARALIAAGVTPEQASRRPEGGETVGYAVSNGDLSATRAAALLAVAR